MPSRQADLTTFFKISSPQCNSILKIDTCDGKKKKPRRCETILTSRKKRILVDSESLRFQKSAIGMISEKKTKQLVQLCIDVGQREFFNKHCPKCGMYFTPGDENDEKLHYNYCQEAKVMKFSGWKKENIVQTFLDPQEIISTKLNKTVEESKIISVTKNDEKAHVKKALEILQFIDSQLGSDVSQNKHDSYDKIFLYIQRRQVVGVLVAEQIEYAHRAIPPETEQVDSLPIVKSPRNSLEVMKLKNCRSHIKVPKNKCNEYTFQQIQYDPCERIPAICGVSRIWVHPSFRRRSIASRLLDACRGHLIYGMVIPPEKTAFSQPTMDGRQLAESYFKNRTFLVYCN